MDNENKRAVYKTEEVAKMLGLSVRTIQRLLKSGKIKGFKVGNQWRIPKDSINEMLSMSKD